MPKYTLGVAAQPYKEAFRCTAVPSNNELGGPGLDHSSVFIKVSFLFFFTGIRLSQKIPDLLLTTFLGNLKFRFGQWSSDFVSARDLKQ